jgi:hypothetical protein
MLAHEMGLEQCFFFFDEISHGGKEKKLPGESKKGLFENFFKEIAIS